MRFVTLSGLGMIKHPFFYNQVVFSENFRWKADFRNEHLMWKLSSPEFSVILMN